MPITVEMMKRAAACGVSAVCASCERYWEARAKGIPGDSCLATQPCGSPMAGDAFSDYRGPLTREAFAKWCFVCGSGARRVVCVGGRARLIGVCEAHLGFVAETRPVAGNKLIRPPDAVVRGNGHDVDFVALAKTHVPKKSLMDVILETELEWAKQDSSTEGEG